MRHLWIRIGVGAGVVFLAGLFVISLGRQVKTAAGMAYGSGGEFRVPLALVPFEVNGERVGSIRGIQVERPADGIGKRLRVEVVLDGVIGSELAPCAILIGHGSSSKPFDCISLSDVDARGLVRIGEVRLEPLGVVRPILVAQTDAEDWLADFEQSEFNLRADPAGSGFTLDGANGEARFRLLADSNGVRIHARDAKGREVVRLDAGAAGVNLKVTDKP